MIQIRIPLIKHSNLVVRIFQFLSQIKQFIHIGLRLLFCLGELQVLGSLFKNLLFFLNLEHLFLLYHGVHERQADDVSKPDFPVLLSPFYLLVLLSLSGQLFEYFVLLSDISLGHAFFQIG